MTDVQRQERQQHQRIVVVTGGGGGIGGAIAEELGRQGAFVVTMDPLVSLDGSEQLPAPEETTAGRIVAAGGSARAASVSVTDRAAVRVLFDDLVEEFGRLDAVINVAGISRPTSFAGGREEDWLAVLGVHLDGYVNVLGAALPIMASAGRGHILGVTSGSGWRPADTGAYGCAKRVVAALTWQLGRVAPPGVTINAMSPIAVTRMVTAALGRVRGEGASASAASASGGLSLGSMPTPDELGPFAAHLVGEDFTWCRGQVLFAGGSEVAVLEPPRLLEVVRADDVASLAPALERIIADVLAPAEAKQASTGGTNPRLGPFADDELEDKADEEADDRADESLPSGPVGSCALVIDRPELAAAVTAALVARGVTCHPVEVAASPTTFGQAADALAAIVDRVGPLDAVVVARRGAAAAIGAPGEWQRVLADHEGMVEHLHTDAGWARAVAEHARSADRPVRLVTLTDASTSGGRSRGQASAQLARAAQKATDAHVAAFAVSMETEGVEGMQCVGAVVGHLVCSPASPALSGAELVAGSGWIGLRSHPHPSGSISMGGSAIPDWLDAALSSIVRVEAGTR